MHEHDKIKLRHSYGKSVAFIIHDRFWKQPINVSFRPIWSAFIKSVVLRIALSCLLLKCCLCIYISAQYYYYVLRVCAIWEENDIVKHFQNAYFFVESFKLEWTKMK